MGVLHSLGRKVIPLHGDEKLVRRAQQGDRQAFDELVSRYKLPLFRYLCRLTGNTTEAEDLTQEAFLKAYRSLGTLRQEDRFKSWLYAIASNLARNWQTRGRRLVQPALSTTTDGEEGDWTSTVEDTGPSVEELSDRTALRERLKEAIARLPSPYKEVVVLRDVEEMSYEEIAQILGVNLGTVKSRIARGRILLQESLLGVQA